MRKGMVALLSVTMASCAGTSRSIYEPRENALADLAGHVAAQYAIPSESPRGAIRLASFGITQISLLGRSWPALHVRVVLSNGGAEPWSIDARTITLALPGRAPVAPKLVNSDVPELPVARVPRGGAVALDLFYPLPARVAAHQPTSFQVQWQVQTESGPAAGATTFDRETLENAPPESPTAGRAKYWWAMPASAPSSPRASLGRPSASLP